jgi:ZIP family zinc transporter/zinc and cadmium transporter
MALMPLLLGGVAALGNVVGAAAVVRRARHGLRVIETSLAFGAGFMLAVVLLGVLPEVFRRFDASIGLWVLGGYLAVHLSQHVLVPHFHFGEETHPVSPAAGVSALAGLSIHSFFDGVAIASGFLESTALGALLFLAVLLHKIPEGVALASIMLAGGQGSRPALWGSVGLGIATLLGIVLTEVALPLQRHGLALAAGVTLYVAASNLVPEFQHAPRRGALSLAFLGGVLAVLLVRILL